MNGRLFIGLKKLSDVSLRGNDCINEDFDDEEKLSTMSQVIDSHCWFAETDEEELTTTGSENVMMDNAVTTKLNSKLVFVLFFLFFFNFRG